MSYVIKFQLVQFGTEYTWTGKHYYHEKELFPISVEESCLPAKEYSKIGYAERGCKAFMKRGYEFVVNARVEEVEK